MKSKLLLGLVVVTFIIGYVVPQVYGVKTEESPLIFIERITFYKDVEESIQNGQVQVRFEQERMDEFSQKTSAAFRKSFLERLEENGLKVADAIPNHPFIGIKVKMAYKEIGGETLCQRGMGVQLLAESLNLDLYQTAMIKVLVRSLVVGGHEVPARRTAQKLGEYFADVLVHTLAQKLSKAE